MKVLITGVTGQMGSYLAEELLVEGNEVYGLCRRTATPRTQNIGHLLDRLVLLDGDLTDRTAISKAINDIKPDIIYNCAAQSHVGYSFQNPSQTMEVNFNGVLNLLEAIRLFARDTKLIQFSTSELFGGMTVGPYNEDSRFYPRSPYGCSKLVSHHLIINYREAYNLWAANAICFNYESPCRGLEFVTRKVTNTVAKIKLGLVDKLVMGNLETYRDWSHCKDIMQGILLMSKQDRPEEFVFCSGRTTSVAQMVQEVFTIAGLGDYKNYLVQDPKFMRPSDVPVLIGDSTKAHKVLGWYPKTTLKEILTEMYEHDLALEKQKHNL